MLQETAWTISNIAAGNVQQIQVFSNLYEWIAIITIHINVV